MKDEIGISPFVLFGRSEKVDPVHDPKGDPGISPFVLMGRIFVDPPTDKETEETRGTHLPPQFAHGTRAWDFIPLPKKGV